PGEVTLKKIMAHPDWLGTAPEDPYWADDGTAIYFEDKRIGEEIRDLVRIDLATGERTVVPLAEHGAASSARGRRSADGEAKVYTRNGDVFVRDLATGTTRQLTRSAAFERAPFFLADGRVGFTRGRTVWIRDLDSGLEAQAAEIVATEDPAENEPADDYLSEQQVRLFDIIKLEKERAERAREYETESRRTDPTRLAPTVYLGDKIEIQRQHLSPAGDWMLVVTHPKKRDLGREDKMPRWVTDSGYVEIEDVRPKVGTNDGSGDTLHLIDLTDGTVHTIETAALPGITDDPLAEIRAAAAQGDESDETLDTAETTEASLAANDNPSPDATAADESASDDAAAKKKAKPRKVDIEDIEFSHDGRWAAVQFHSVDNKDRWTVVVGREQPEARTVHRLSNPDGWINWSFNSLGWLGGDALWFLSEDSGWSQLYIHQMGVDGALGSTRRLTDGDYVVEDGVVADPDERYLYFQANRAHPGIYEIHRVPVSGGAVETLTDLGGMNDFVLSPDGTQLLITHSSATQPPELWLQPIGGSARKITNETSDDFAAIAWTAPTFVEVPSSHQDRPIHSRLYLPHDEVAGPRGAVVFVHGAGYLQNAHQGWSGYFREFMFHTLLAREGYVVLDMDYRASRGYGADWRTAIYRQMGTPELEDLIDGVDYLVANHNVDRSRVGVYGGSYGGFMVFMSMFKEPELFACGASLRPVTDWAHYNHPYTSNILNTPEDDPEAYERSSPIEFADGLAKPLLIAAPMLDDNVFFLDTVRLVQRFIELEKEDFEVALYPIEPHGFREPSSWLDEYRRIFKLFAECLDNR
ncbi:MAG: prolyl oligopeptidase family serine peptidase, partial [Acidobacteriota bacterium]